MKDIEFQNCYLFKTNQFETQILHQTNPILLQQLLSKIEFTLHFILLLVDPYFVYLCFSLSSAE